MKLLTGCLAVLFAATLSAQKSSVPVITDSDPSAFTLAPAEHEIGLPLYRVVWSKVVSNA